MDEIDIRYSELSEKKYLIEWLSDSKIGKWYPPTNEKELNIFAENWIGFSKFKASLTAVLSNEVCGIGSLFLMPYRKVAHHCMFYMVVDPSQTKNGIGTSLLKNVLNLAENYFRLESIIAEVFEGSPLIGLLEKFDFEIFAKQKNFVKENGVNHSRILYQHFFRKKTL